MAVVRMTCAEALGSGSVWISPPWQPLRV